MFFFTFPPVHSNLKKLKLGKKKIPTSRLAVFFPTRPTGNDFLLKGGLGLRGVLHSGLVPSCMNLSVCY